MNLKYFVSLALALFLVGFSAAAVAVFIVDDGTTLENQQSAVATTESDAAKPVESTATEEEDKETTPTATASNPAPPPTPAPQPVLKCGNGGPCTSAEVAAHSSASDCWGIYAGRVYNLTAYVPKHDGGSAAFNSQSCGGDITAYLNGSSGSGGVKAHRHSQKAYSILNSYYIADLK